jgi:colanic acid biosynthesis glycosyl transferase WcaI
LEPSIPKILILYHYYWPDDVVSAVQFTGLAEGLAAGGYEIETWPGNRSCHDPKVSYPTSPETNNGVRIHRVWRPPFSQHSFLGRILNSFWVQKFWWLRLFFSTAYKPDVILIGTDPLLSLLSVPFLKLIRPKAKIIHWCFDLYPEAAVADGILKEGNSLVKIVKSFMNRGYRKCDLVADIGPCMREKLERYQIQKRATLTPWALEEPSQPLPYDAQERMELFGKDPGPLGLLYSGSFGRAHDFYLTLKLARFMRNKAVFTYGVRGSRLDELKRAVNPEDANVRFAPFTPPGKLSARLSAPDVHLVSLRPEWTGIVVPSKFFGALAVGRPLLFEGDEKSSIARWIKEYGVGWVLTPGNLDSLANELEAFSKNPSVKREMFNHCHAIYQSHFSKKVILGGWIQELGKI